ncbi:MAG: PEP-CTERM sorting domain-containing protein [Planctomycetota bacterium]
MKTLIMIMVLLFASVSGAAWVSPTSVVDVFGLGYWEDLGFSIDNDLDTFTTEVFAPAQRPIQYFFEETHAVMICLEEPHGIVVEYPYGDRWYELYNGMVDSRIVVDSVYPIETIKVTSLDLFRQLKISDVYVPEPTTLILLACGAVLVFAKRWLNRI